MQTIAFYCDAHSVEQNAMEQLQHYAQRPDIQTICAFTDIHYCAEKALPVGVAFETTDHCYPLITGKDIAAGSCTSRSTRPIGKSPSIKRSTIAPSIGHTPK